MNVAVYGTNGSRWAMTERRRSALGQSRAAIQIGPSWMSWDGNALDVWIDEIASPIPQRIRGRIRLSEGANAAAPIAIDGSGSHTWQPLVTAARIEVDLQSPGQKWTGTGYFDTNYGEEPLEKGFRSWNWGRAQSQDGTIVQYDLVKQNGERRDLTVLVDRAGVANEIELPAQTCLAPTSLWRIPRKARHDASGTAVAARTLEDTPFYARSLVRADVLGEPTLMMHESLELGRFSNPVVKAMLAFRMPRRWI